MVDKADLWSPVAADTTEWRTKQPSKATMDTMANMSRTELMHTITRTGTIYQPSNPLFSDEIYFEPHLQVRTMVLLTTRLTGSMLQILKIAMSLFFKAWEL